jgi:hypothetical protein
MGVGERPKAYRIHPHHESAKASTKNATIGRRCTALDRPDIIWGPPLLDDVGCWDLLAL